MRRILFASLMTFALAAAGRATPPDVPDGEKQPVLVYLFSRLDDHVNFALTEDRAQRTMAMLDQARAQSPSSTAKVLLEFSGASSDVIGQRNNATHLVDRILEHARNGVVEIGYYGAWEPTHMSRPSPNFRGVKTPEQRWLARLQPIQWFLSEYKEYLAGTPDPGHTGGLQRTREVFGDLASIAGVTPMDLGGEAEAVHAIRQLQTAAFTMRGVPEGYTWPAKNLHGFGGAVFAFSNLMAPSAEFAAELYEIDHVLHVSDTSGPAVKIVPAYRGREALEALIKGLDRSRPHVIRLQLGPPDMYLQPSFNRGILNPLLYAYENPKMPYLPPVGALRSSNEIDAAYAKEAEVLQWLMHSFFPENPGSRFVSSSNLIEMTAGPDREEVSREVLSTAARNLLNEWKVIGNNPPSFARAGSRAFSLAEMFQLLSASLSDLHRTGKLPQAVRALPVYGPEEMTEEQGPATGSVSVASMAQAGAALAEQFGRQEWKPFPENRIPAWVQVDGLRLNAAQCLRLMAEAFVAGDRSARLPVKTSLMFSAAAEVYPRTRLRSEEGSMWTLKPARLVRAQGSSRASL